MDNIKISNPEDTSLLTRAYPYCRTNSPRATSSITIVHLCIMQ